MESDAEVYSEEAPQLKTTYLDERRPPKSMHLDRPGVDFRWDEVQGDGLRADDR